jgi:hypothetical protein
MTLWRMRIAYWIPKATNTLSEYVILIAVPLKLTLHERSAPAVRTSPVLCRITTYRSQRFVRRWSVELIPNALKCQVFPRTVLLNTKRILM